MKYLMRSKVLALKVKNKEAIRKLEKLVKWRETCLMTTIFIPFKKTDLTEVS